MFCFIACSGSLEGEKSRLSGFRKVLNCSLCSVCRYSAIRCARAVPMSSLELQQAREIHRAPTPEPENKKPGMNGEANLASKPSTKPQKGIMGMFANKPAPKNQENGKDIKLEPKDDAHVVWLWLSLV